MTVREFINTCRFDFRGWVLRKDGQLMCDAEELEELLYFYGSENLVSWDIDAPHGYSDELKLVINV